MSDDLGSLAVRERISQPPCGLPRPRILVLFWGRRAGTLNHTLELTRALLRRDDLDVCLSLSRQCDRFEDFAALGRPICSVDTYTSAVSFAASPWRLPVAAARLLKFLYARRVQTVLCCAPHWWSPILVPLIHACGRRYILTVHDDQPHAGDRMAVSRWWSDWEIRSAHGVITLSQHVRQRLLMRLGLSPDRVAVIPSGPYTLAAGSAAPRQRTIPRRLLFFGRLWPYKGLDLLLEAYAHLKPRYPDLSLHIAGSGDFSPYRQVADALPDVTTDLRFIPEQEVSQVLLKGDVLVLPYREATQSGLVMLAQAVGLPVVATPVGGLVEQITHGQTGLLASQATAEALAAALSRLLDDPSLCQRLREGIRAQGSDLWDEAAAQIVPIVDCTGRPAGNHYPTEAVQ